MKKVCTAIVLSTTLIMGACASIRPTVTRPDKRILPDLDFKQSEEPGKIDRTTVEKAAEPTEPGQEAGRSVDSNPSGLPNDMMPDPIAYEVVSDSLPIEVESLIDENREKAGYFARRIEDEWYVTVLMGEQKTDGYDISIEAIEEKAGETLIKVAESEPSEDEMVLMAPTYPFQVVRIKDGMIPDFKVINQEGGIYPEVD